MKSGFLRSCSLDVGRVDDVSDLSAHGTSYLDVALVRYATFESIERITVRVRRHGSRVNGFVGRSSHR